MTTTEIITNLEQFSKWRLDADIKQPHPEKITETIQNAIKQLKKEQKEVRQIKKCIKETQIMSIEYFKLGKENSQLACFMIVETYKKVLKLKKLKEWQE